MLLDRYCKRLKRLDKTGAEAQKVDSTQKTIRKLSARIRVAIQVVQSISNKVNKVRNEELWPQICEVIQGYGFFLTTIYLFVMGVMHVHF